MLSGALFAACATGPRHFGGAARLGSGGGFPFFPPGASWYGYIDKKDGAELYAAFFFEGSIQDKTARGLLAKTDHITFAFYGGAAADSGGADGGVLALLRGRGYPVARSALYFTFSSDWKKRKLDGGGAYWQWKQGGTAIALTRKAALLATGGAMFTKEAVSVPRGYGAFQAGALAGGYVPSAAFLDDLLAANGLPLNLQISNILFAVRRHQFGYEIAFRLETPGGAQAKLTGTLLTMLRRNRDSIDEEFRPLFDIFLANPARTEGPYVFLTSAPLGANAAAGLLRAVLLY
jgi:hypothetical protein